MGSKFNFRLIGYKPYDTVYFFPYTTDLPEIKVGQIVEDDDGLFIGYDTCGLMGTCDDGECVLCKTDELSKDIVKKINSSLFILGNKQVGEIRRLKDRIKELENNKQE